MRSGYAALGHERPDLMLELQRPRTPSPPSKMPSKPTNPSPGAAWDALNAWLDAPGLALALAEGEAQVPAALSALEAWAARQAPFAQAFLVLPRQLAATWQPRRNALMDRGVQLLHPAEAETLQAFAHRFMSQLSDAAAEDLQAIAQFERVHSELRA